MRMRNTQFDLEQRSVSHGPLVVYGQYKNRDGPLIYHKRDGPLFNTGPPRGTGPPAGTGPPLRHGPPGRTGPQHETGSPNGHGPPFKKKQTGVEFESTKVMEKLNINLKREETKMKNFKLKRLLSLATMGLLAALHIPTVFAAAGDPIGNRATLTFDVGGAATLLESDPLGNTTTGLGAGNDTFFTEDRLINFTVTTVDTIAVTVAPGVTAQVQEFTVTNNGNGFQDFLLAAIDLPNGATGPFTGTDNFDTAASSVFVESGATSGYQVTEDTAIFLDEIAIAGSETVYIVSTIPGGLSNNDVAVTTLVVQVAVDNNGTTGTEGAAIMRDDNGNVSPAGTYSNGTTGPTVPLLPNDVGDIATGIGSEQIVFNDPAGAIAADVDSGGTVQDIARNGQHSSSNEFIVGVAILTVRKVSLALWDPVNGNSNPKAILGAYVQYTITVSNDVLSGASGDLTILSDTLVLTDLDPNLILATATTPVPGTVVGVDIESAVGDSIRMVTSGTTRPSDSTNFYCMRIANGDGCDHTAGIGNALTVDFSLVAAMGAEDVAPPGAGPEDYVAGELKPGDSVDIVFNVIVQP